MVRHLAVIAGPDRGQVFPLPDGVTVTIGRGLDALARLGDPHVSRIHCRIAVAGDRLVLTDAGSTAGTLVNGQSLAAEHALRTGDVIQVGQTQLRLDEDAPPDQPTMALPGEAPVPPTAAVVRLADLIGQTLGSYEVVAVRARGQSGLVFLARDTRSGEDVALKVLAPEFGQRPSNVERFRRAAETVLPLHHPNLVALRESGQTGPYCWLAMDWIEGESLADVIERIGVAGMLDWRFAVRVAIQVGRALQAAHARQIVHRNLTPRNVLVRFPERTALLGDLMLARALEGELAREVTRPGELIGDVRYLPPERIIGGTLDVRSDIYGLGALVYALLTGRPPLAGGSLLETLALIRTAEPPRPKQFQLSIGDPFEDVVMRMLAKRPEDRHQTAADLLIHLERSIKYQGIQV